MCGFVGFIDENDQTYDHRATIVAMANAIAHRGPDSEGYFSDGRAALGFRRLAIIDLAGANQPLYNENRSLVLVFNGEIYNYQELRRQLIAAGHTFSTQGDAEVMLHGFEQWGEGVLDRLRGMFAFALYRPATGELFCARDAFGIKPLYYAVEGERILFGSEIKGLITHPRAHRSLNERRLAHWKASASCPPAIGCDGATAAPNAADGSPRASSPMRAAVWRRAPRPSRLPCGSRWRPMPSPT